jgi:hypothetical protein
VALIGHSDLVKPDPTPYSTDKPVSFRHLDEVIHYAAIHDAEIARIERYLDIRHSL